jgi:hypothetical protein
MLLDGRTGRLAGLLSDATDPLAEHQVRHEFQ